MPNLTVEGLAGSSPLACANGSPLMVKRSIIQGLKKLIPTVRTSLDKYQARYKRNWDSRVRPKNKDLAVGDFVYLRSHRGGHKLLPKALGPFEILDADGTNFAIDQGDNEGRVKSNDVTPAPRPVSGPDYQPHQLTQAPLPDENSSDENPTWEIDRLLSIRHDADNGIVAKVRWATYGRGDDSWEPISGLPKHFVIRLEKQKKFTLRDDAFPTTPVVLAPRPRQPDWVCVAVQQHTDETGAVLVDVRWTLRQPATRRMSLPFGQPPSSRSSPMTHHLPTGHWDDRLRETRCGLGPPYGRPVHHRRGNPSAPVPAPYPRGRRPRLCRGVLCRLGSGHRVGQPPVLLFTTGRRPRRLLPL